MESLDLIEGEVLALVGESGSGKSVLTKTFTGMLEDNGRIAQGSIDYRGQDLTALTSNKEWEKIRGAKIATIFQDPMTSLDPINTIGSQITEVIVKHQGKTAKEAKEMAIDYMNKVGIPDAEKRFEEYPFQYSGGMRQRIVIAIALACRPDILICDGILALSLVLITSFSISSALPAMFDYYQGYPKEQIELLVSLPSFGIMIMLVLNGFLERLFPERLQISLGLLILSIGGTAPFWYQEYNFVFAMRILFGLGVGMINAKAISIISERYHGKTRIQMLGLRGSAEVVGASILTLVVGQLLSLGWTVTFLAYSAGFLVLILYLLFVPYGKEKKETKNKETETTRLTGKMKGLIFLLAVEAAVVVCTNTAITIRIPVGSYESLHKGNPRDPDQSLAHFDRGLHFQT